MWGTILAGIAILVTVALALHGQLVYQGDTYQVSSQNQNGGITTGKIEINNGGIETPTEKPDSRRRTFTFAHAPSVIVRDGVSMKKVASDGTINWTGTTTVTLALEPVFDIYGEY